MGDARTTRRRSPGVLRRRLLRAAGTLVAAALAASCTASSEATAPARSTDTACQGRTDLARESQRRTMRFGGVTREYEVHLPPGYDDTTPAPVVLNLHGLTSTIQEQDTVSGLPAAARRRGYVVVTPQARPATLTIAWREVLATYWNALATMTPPPGAPPAATVAPDAADDTGFLLALLDTVEDEYCVDPAREYVTGISNGASMAVALMCADPDRFAAVAPVAGVNLGGRCAVGAPNSVVAFHGDADPLVPFRGGSVPDLPFGSVPVEDLMTELATAGGCAAPPEPSIPAELTIHLAWPCPDGVDVELYIVVGGGHSWFGSATNYRRPTTTTAAPPSPEQLDLDPPVRSPGSGVVATEVMLDFFDAHRRA